MGGSTFNYMIIRRIEKNLETFEKKLTLKFSQNQEISLGFQSVIWSMLFLNLTKIAFSCSIIISKCHVILQDIPDFSLDSNEHFTYV